MNILIILFSKKFIEFVISMTYLNLRVISRYIIRMHPTFFLAFFVMMLEGLFLHLLQVVRQMPSECYFHRCGVIFLLVVVCILANEFVSVSRSLVPSSEGSTGCLGKWYSWTNLQREILFYLLLCPLSHPWQTCHFPPDNRTAASYATLPSMASGEVHRPERSQLQNWSNLTMSDPKLTQSCPSDR